MAPVRFGSVTVWGWKGSIGSGGSSTKRVFSVFQYIFKGKDGSGSGFGTWKTVPAVPVPLSVSGKTVLTVPVSGSGSAPEPPCHNSGNADGAQKSMKEAVLSPCSFAIAHVTACILKLYLHLTLPPMK